MSNMEEENSTKGFTVASSGEDLRVAAREGDLDRAQEVVNRYRNSEELAKFLPAVLASADRLSGNRALHLCAANGHVEMVRFFIGDKVDVNATNHAGSTPLHYASLTGHVDIAKELINNNAEPVIENKYGRTALDEARSSGQSSIAEFLLAHVESIGSTPDIDSGDANEKAS